MRSGGSAEMVCAPLYYPPCERFTGARHAKPFGPYRWWEDITTSTCCCWSQCSGFGSTVLHHCAPFRSHLALSSAWLAKASSYPNSVPHEGQMVKFFGGSSSRSYPQRLSRDTCIQALTYNSTENTAKVFVGRWATVL